MTDLEECAKRVGTTVRDKWKLERLLGVGGMAAVYVAVHKIGRRDAIKILHPEVAKSPEVRARFQQEAQAVNAFKHPGAVEIRDIDVTEDGAPFLVMELLEGETLSRIVRREPGPTVEDVLRWTDELLDVLAAAHAQGIVHRDIKPDNLFVLTDGRLKVLDFGIARVRSGAAMSMKTATGATIGTVSYMPPEQAKGGDIDARADIFAVGATMFRLIARRKIHEAESDLELLKKMATEQAPKLATVTRSAPDAVARIVDRALEFDRDARYPDATAMQADVRAARSAQPSSLASSVPAMLASAASPLAASVDTPASQRSADVARDPAPSEAPTVGKPRGSEVPTAVEGVASSLPTRPDTTLRSGPPGPPSSSGAAQQLITAKLAPIVLPVAAPVASPSPPAPATAAIAAAPPAAIASAPHASAPPTPRDKWKLPLMVGGSIAVFLIVVTIGVLAATVWLVKSAPVDTDDAAAAAVVVDPLDAAASDDGASVPSTPTPAASATHKPSAAPTKTTAPAPPHPSGHGPHGK